MFVAGLQSNQFDVFVGGSFATPKRAAVIDFSRPIMYMGHSVAVRKEDLGKVQVAGRYRQAGHCRGYGVGQFGLRIFKGTPETRDDTWPRYRRPFPGRVGSFGRPSRCRIAGFFKIAQVVNLHSDKLTDVFGAQPFHLVFVSYAVAKGNRDLLQLINTSLEWMDLTGKWQELAKPYGNQLSGVYLDVHNYKSFGSPTAGK